MNARDYYLDRYAALFEKCESLGIPPPQARVIGGAASIESEGQADRIIAQLLEGLRADYPEHAEGLEL